MEEDLEACQVDLEKLPLKLLSVLLNFAALCFSV